MSPLQSSIPHGDALGNGSVATGGSIAFNGSILRKVRSLDFLRRHNHPDTLSGSCVASKFSHDSHGPRRNRSSARLADVLESEGPYLKSNCFLTAQETKFVDSESRSESEQRLLVSLLMNRPLRLGYMSLLALLLVTATDFALGVVNAQIHRIDSTLNYDALSTEVISPPFRYKAHMPSERPQRMGLGMAAISSFTNALSPVLPFTGGVDLRRQEHWQADGWLNSFFGIVIQTRDAFNPGSVVNSVPRGGGNGPPNSKTIARRKKGNKNSVAVLSASKPFVPVNDIADLTLSDVATTFKYAVQGNSASFDQSKFHKGLNDQVKKVVSAIDATTGVSRGKDVGPAVTKKRDLSSQCLSPLECGDVDALQFCAAMRIFAEWRVVRQVPEGYKGYAVGMNLGQKDIVQNVAKIEDAVHSWINYNRELANEDPAMLRGPTLRELLQHEIDIGEHKRLPRLKERSAAMGLLWVRRQLHYQTALFANVLKVPDKFSSTSSAVSAAYSEVYNKYHGWAVQKIFNYSFQAAPEAEEIYKFMNPRHLKEVTEEARSQRTDQRLDVITEEELSKNPLERFGRHVGSEWGRFVSNVVGIFDKKQMKLRGGAEQPGDHEIERYVRERMSRDAHSHILVYLNVANPLLRDLAGLFKDLNMDDPSKV